MCVTPEPTIDPGFEADQRLASSLLLYFSPVEWTGLVQRPHQLARIMSYSFQKVIFVQPSGLRSLHRKDLPRVVSWLSTKWSKGAHKGKGPWKEGAADRLEICSPWFVPFSGNSLVDRINSIICSHTLQPFLQGGPKQQIVFWVSAPFPFLPHLLDRIHRRVHVVYDLIDDYRLFHPDLPRIYEVQDILMRRAEIVFASSTRLLAKALEVKARDRAAFLPNGVDLSHWRVEKKPVPQELERISRPMIGYFGTIADWMDFDLLSALTQKRTDWQFVFIGPQDKGKQVRWLFERSNVHYLGPKPYARMPLLVEGFDVCWIPFKVNGLTETINPIKLYESLALGKPVVAPPLPDLLHLEPCVEFAHTMEEYEEAIDRCLGKTLQKDLATRCRSLVEKFAWSALWGNSKPDLERLVNEY